MKINEITTKQLNEIALNGFKHDPLSLAVEDNELTEKLMKTPFVMLSILPSLAAVATGVRIGLALAREESAKPVAGPSSADLL